MLVQLASGFMSTAADQLEDRPSAKPLIALRNVGMGVALTVAAALVGTAGIGTRKKQGPGE